MKVRVGFVSNSSTTSFCIYGIHFEDKEEVYSRLQPEVKKKYKSPDELCVCSLFNDVKGVDYNGGCNYDRYFGEEYSNMDPDETKREFQERTAKLLSEVFTGITSDELSVHEESFRDD